MEWNLSLKIQEILEFLNERLGESPAISNRIGTESWTWDGENIAAHYYGNGFSWDACHNFSNFDEFRSTRKDAVLLHEICHWICSTKRSVPEFAMKRGHSMVDTQAWGSAGGEFRAATGWLKHDAINKFDTIGNYGSDNLLSFDEQMIQEYTSQRLTILLGYKFDIPVEGFRIPHTCNSWGKYEIFKTEEWTYPDGFRWPNEPITLRNLWFENNTSNNGESKIRFNEIATRLIEQYNCEEGSIIKAISN